MIKKIKTKVEEQQEYSQYITKGGRFVKTYIEERDEAIEGDQSLDQRATIQEPTINSRTNRGGKHHDCNQT